MPAVVHPQSFAVACVGGKPEAKKPAAAAPCAWHTKIDPCTRILRCRAADSVIALAR